MVEEGGAPLRVVASRSHRSELLDAWFAAMEARWPEIEVIGMGSSLKLCLVAEGQADIYPRLGPTSEWDTAAAQAVLEAAGGAVLGPSGERLRYNHKESLLNPHFSAQGNPGLRFITA
jgi:3'(2'), 5'-bisphosphate nucleotidase